MKKNEKKTKIKKNKIWKKWKDENMIKWNKWKKWKDEKKKIYIYKYNENMKIIINFHY